MFITSLVIDHSTFSRKSIYFADLQDIYVVLRCETEGFEVHSVILTERG